MKTRFSLWVVIAVLIAVSLACDATDDLGTVSDIGKAFMALLKKADHQAS